MSQPRRPSGPAPLPTLDALDRRLLAALDRDPGAPVSALAQSLGASTRTIARRYARLRETDVVRVVGRTLPGFGGRLVRSARVAVVPGAALAVAQTLADEPESRWVRVSRDRREVHAGFVGEQGPLAADALDARAGVLGVTVVELLRVWAGSRQPALRAERALDEADRRILALLSADGRMESSAIAARLRLDASTVSRRRRRLIEEGVLYLEADIHPGALSEAGDAMLWIRAQPGRVRELGSAMRALPDVRFAAATSGPWSLVANVVLPEAGDLVDFVDEQLADRGVEAIEIVPMGRVVKRLPPGGLR